MSHANQFNFLHSESLANVTLLRASMTDFAYGTHAHEEFSLGVTLTGRQDFFTQGQFQHSHPGQVMVFNPGDAHDGTSGADAALHYKMLYVHPKQFEPFLQTFHVSQPEHFRIKDAVFTDKAIQGNILRLARLIELQESTASEYDTVLFELIEQLVRYQQSAPVERHNSRRNRLLDRAKECLEDNYDQDVSLDQLSQVACMSKYHFLRSFKDYTGMTPHQYWLNGRINRARQALRQDTPVAQIATQLGFNDLSHFNRRFKPVFGLTPRQYQRLILTR